MFKKIFTILLCVSMLLGFASCKKEEEATAVLDFCETMKQQGEDLNLVGCFITEPFEGSKELVLYIPDAEGLGWNRITKTSLFAEEEKINPYYASQVLSAYMFGDPDLFDTTFSNPLHTANARITFVQVEKFVELYKPDALPSGEEDDKGIKQVIATCLSDTILANCPEMEYVETVSDSFKEISPVQDYVYIDPKTLNPYFFGSENSYIGDTSYDNFVQQLKDNGVNLEDYPEGDRLYIVNSFVYNIMSAYRKDSNNSDGQ